MSYRDVTSAVIVFSYQWLNLCYLMIYVCCVGKHDGFDYLYIKPQMRCSPLSDFDLVDTTILLFEYIDRGADRVTFVKY